MASINSVVMVGRLCADPESKEVNGGFQKCDFTIAVDRSRKDANGEKKTDFFKAVCWNQTAKFLSTWAHKGDLVAVTGSMHIDTWENADGEKCKSYVINCAGVELLTRKAETDLG